MNKPIRVLMVDDEERFRKTTQKILNKRGFDTLIAGSGEEALERLSGKPDVVVLDIKMPGMDGHQSLAAIKKKQPHLPVIMLTGHGSTPSARQAYGQGAFDYLSKPCDVNLLAEKIKEAARQDDKAIFRIEKNVGDIMVPLEEYSLLNENNTLVEAVAKLKTSFTVKFSTSSIMEAGHWSVLVMDGHNQQVKGIIDLRDLLTALLPEYLSAAKPSTADSISYSPLFWQEMFTAAVRNKRQLKTADIMSPVPLAIDAGASLMEAVYRIVTENTRRLLVTAQAETVGIVRERDLFVELEQILLSDLAVSKIPIF